MNEQFHGLTKRLVASVIIVAVLGCLIIFAHHLAIQIVWVILAAGVAVLGSSECASLIKAKGIHASKLLMGLSAVLLIVAFYFHLSPIALILSAIFFFIFHFSKIEGAISSVGTQFFSTAYVSVPIGLMLQILFLPHTGRLWLVYLIAVTKGTDIAAYFGGKLLGKRPLAPLLSPKKTLAGAFFGIAGALIISLLLAAIPSLHLSLVKALILGLLFGVFGQVGDLAESLLKRDAGVKDSSRLPGLGGVLDILDSLLFTTPLLSFYLFMA